MFFQGTEVFRMKIIIVGCGKVGSTLAAQLNSEGNNVTIIDQDAAKVKALANKLDIMGVIGNGASRSTQKDAGVDSTDLLIAVTGNDELNLLSCLVAKKSANCRTIARLKNPEYNNDAPYFKNELGLAMVINPEPAAAREISRVLNFPSAIKIETFAKGRVELLKFKLPEGSRLVGMSVKDVAMKLKSSVTFCTIERGDEAYIANGNFTFEAKDVISIIASPAGAKAFFKKIDYQIIITTRHFRWMNRRKHFTISCFQYLGSIPCNRMPTCRSRSTNVRYSINNISYSIYDHSKL